MTILELLSFGGEVGGGLQFFPLMHQVAHLPHERLVTIHDRLGGGSIVIEAGCRHQLFELPDRLLAFGDPHLELIDPVAVCLLRPLPLASLGVSPLLLFATRRHF